MQIVHTPWQMLRLLLILLAAAVGFACLFSLMLPASASLLAPTATPTRTATYTPTVTQTPTPTLKPTSTFTPPPQNLSTPQITPFGSYSVFWQSDVWTMIIDPSFRVEGFDRDPLSTQSLTMPYVTANGFWITGNGFPVITSSSLLPTGNLLFVRDGVQEITLSFPEGQAVGAFSFDYVTQEEWVLTFNNFSIRLPPARVGFVGVLFQKHFPTDFTLSSSADVQGGLLLDNIRYAAPFMPSTPTSTITYTPTPTFTPEPSTP